ncbi:MAG: SPOR domain-containing protein [Campylobacteraceae bacterium]|nr:SPOR domain-containing protein [Campylobacteraceae bacterium]
MEIKGENFVKNIQVKQEKDEIQQRLDEIEREMPHIQSTPTFQNQLNNMELEEKELDDIILESDDIIENKDNKKKYIVLGLVLILLFLITVIVIRLFTNDKSTDDSFVNDDEIQMTQEEMLDNENIEDKYQKLLNEKLEIIKNKNNSLNDSMNIEKTQEDEIEVEKIIDPIEEKKVIEIKKEIEEIKKEKPVEKVVKPVYKTIVKKPIKKVKISKSVSGVYIQVGSFTKQPSNSYLANILDNGFKYKLYQIKVNGKTFTKVLVGPFRDRNDAKAELNSIKTLLNVPSAWIIKI